MGSNKGFTLIELMVVLALITIIALIAAPGYQGLMSGNRMISVSNNLMGALQLARSEAVTRNQSVSVCSSSNQTSCGGSWADGGIVLLANGEVLRVLTPLPSDIAVNGNTIQYNNEGQLAASSALTVTNSGGARTVQVNRIGQVSICKGSSC
ncbi:GspH/FimT family pseudopilin [Pseudomonas sp.]|uniref:GspH/FimT family pseudopilin n=1 Tax=Pseudomonas sp. TaxID=306 RepID=UPI003D136C3A